MASTALITDISSVITTGPGTATKAACIAAAGPINDYNGNCNLLKLHLQESYKLAKMLHDVTDNADSANKQLLQDILDSLD